MDDSPVQDESFTPFLRAVECVDHLKLPPSGQEKQPKCNIYGSLLAVLTPYPLVVAARGDTLYVFSLPKGKPRASSDSASEAGGSQDDGRGVDNEAEEVNNPLAVLKLPNSVRALYSATHTELEPSRASLLVVADASTAMDSVLSFDVSMLLTSSSTGYHPLQPSRDLRESKCICVEPVYPASGGLWDGNRIAMLHDNGTVGIYTLKQNTSIPSIPGVFYVQRPIPHGPDSAIKTCTAVSVAALIVPSSGNSAEERLLVAVGSETGLIDMYACNLHPQGTETIGSDLEPPDLTTGTITAVESHWLPRFLRFLSSSALLVTYQARRGECRHFVWYLNRSGQPDGRCSRLGELCYSLDAPASSEDTDSDDTENVTVKTMRNARFDTRAPTIVTTIVPSWSVAVLASSLSTDLEVLGLAESGDNLALSSRKTERPGYCGSMNSDSTGIWINWKLDEGQSLTLPADENFDDCMPVGVALNLTNAEPVPAASESEPPLQPMPRLVVLSSRGVILSYLLADDRQGAYCSGITNETPMSNLVPAISEVSANRTEHLPLLQQKGSNVAVHKDAISESFESMNFPNVNIPSKTKTASRFFSSAREAPGSKLGATRISSLNAEEEEESDSRDAALVVLQENGISRSFRDLRRAGIDDDSSNDSIHSDEDNTDSFHENATSPQKSSGVFSSFCSHNLLKQDCPPSKSVAQETGQKSPSLQPQNAFPELGFLATEADLYPPGEDGETSNIRQIMVPNLKNAMEAAATGDPVSQLRSIILEMEEEVCCVGRVLDHMAVLTKSSEKKLTQVHEHLSARVNSLNLSVTDLLQRHEDNSSRANTYLKDTFSVAKDVEDTVLLFRTAGQELKMKDVFVEESHMDKSFEKKHAEVEKTLCALEDRLESSVRQLSTGRLSPISSCRHSSTAGKSKVYTPSVRDQILSALSMQGIRIARVRTVLDAIEMQFLEHKRLLRGHEDYDVGISQARLQRLAISSADSGAIEATGGLSSRKRRHVRNFAAAATPRRPQYSTFGEDAGSSQISLVSPSTARILRDLAMRGGRENVKVNPQNTSSGLLRDTRDDCILSSGRELTAPYGENGIEHSSSVSRLTGISAKNHVGESRSATPVAAIPMTYQDDENLPLSLQRHLGREYLEQPQNASSNSKFVYEGRKKDLLVRQRPSIPRSPFSKNSQSAVQYSYPRRDRELDVERITGNGQSQTSRTPNTLVTVPLSSSTTSDLVPTKMLAGQHTSSSRTNESESIAQEHFANTSDRPSNTLSSFQRDLSAPDNNLNAPPKFIDAVSTESNSQLTTSRSQSHSERATSSQGPGSANSIGVRAQTNCAPAVESFDSAPLPPVSAPFIANYNGNQDIIGSNSTANSTTHSSVAGHQFSAIQPSSSKTRNLRLEVTSNSINLSVLSSVAAINENSSVQSRPSHAGPSDAIRPSAQPSADESPSQFLARLPPDGSELDTVPSTTQIIGKSVASEYSTSKANLPNSAPDVASLPPDGSETDLVPLQKSETTDSDSSRNALLSATLPSPLQLRNVPPSQASAAPTPQMANDSPNSALTQFVSSDRKPEQTLVLHGQSSSSSSAETLTASVTADFENTLETTDTKKSVIPTNTASELSSAFGQANIVDRASVDGAASKSVSGGQGVGIFVASAVAKTETNKFTQSADSNLANQMPSMPTNTGSPLGRPALNPSPFVTPSAGHSTSFSFASSGGVLPTQQVGIPSASSLFGGGSTTNAAASTNFTTGFSSPFVSTNMSGTTSSPAGNAFGTAGPTASFGAPSKLGASVPTPSFGASSSIGFGQTSAFGASTSAGFGQNSTFGASASVGFGQTSTFGSPSQLGGGIGRPAFGSSPPLFGQQGSGASSGFSGFAGLPSGSSAGFGNAFNTGTPRSSGFGSQSQQSSPFGASTTNEFSGFAGLASAQQTTSMSSAPYTSPAFTQRRG